jgi:hypothetical protein
VAASGETVFVAEMDIAPVRLVSVRIYCGHARSMHREAASSETALNCARLWLSSLPFMGRTSDWRLSSSPRSRAGNWIMHWQCKTGTAEVLVDSSIARVAYARFR